MYEANSLSSPDGRETIAVLPCPCGGCDGITLLVEQRKGRKRRRLELSFPAATATVLQELLEQAKKFHAAKASYQDWSPDRN